MHADRAAARDQQHIEFQAALQIFLQFGRVVARDAEQIGLYAQRLHLRHQRITVGVGNLVRIDRVVDVFQLVAGGQDRHARKAIDLHLRAFTVASTPITPGVISVPAASTTSPLRMPSPCTRMSLPGFTATLIST